MANQGKFEELIVAYLANELDTEEEALIVEWINSSEGNRKRFQELDKAFNFLSVHHEIENIDVESEWTEFTKSIVISEQGLPEKLKARDYYHEVQPEIITSRRRSFSGRIGLLLAAASLIVFFVIKSDLFLASPEGGIVAPDVDGAIKKHVYKLQHYKNQSGKEQKYDLEDGTLVLLNDQSELSYSVPFPDTQRDIDLKGKALFKVAREKSRPFTVKSGDILTTALGTEFTVDAYEKSSKITIKLFEGKVVIRSASGLLKKEIYLIPGQELTYNKLNGVAKVRNFGVDGNNASLKANANDEQNDRPVIPKFEKGSWYMFNNQALPDVFSQLQVVFQTEIVYSKKDVAKIYFIGRFNKADSLEVILKRIATINNLKLTRENNKYFIAK